MYGRSIQLRSQVTESESNTRRKIRSICHASPLVRTWLTKTRDSFSLMKNTNETRLILKTFLAKNLFGSQFHQPFGAKHKCVNIFHIPLKMLLLFTNICAGTWLHAFGNSFCVGHHILFVITSPNAAALKRCGIYLCKPCHALAPIPLVKSIQGISEQITLWDQRNSKYLLGQNVQHLLPEKSEVKRSHFHQI